MKRNGKKKGTGADGLKVGMDREEGRGRGRDRRIEEGEWGGYVKGRKGEEEGR